MNATTRIGIVLTLLALSATARGQTNQVQPGGKTPPVVLWASDPVRGGEAVMILGDGLARTTRIDVARQADPSPGQPNGARPETSDRWMKVEPLQLTNQTVKFVLPKALPIGVYVVRITSRAGVTAWVLNRPTITWLIGDEGPEATTGGRVRLFGRCLSLVKESIELRSAHRVILLPGKLDTFPERTACTHRGPVARGTVSGSGRVNNEW